MKKFLLQTFLVALLITPGAFLGSYYGAQSLAPASAQAIGNGSGVASGSGTVTSATAADTTLTQTGTPTINPAFALNVGNATTITGGWTFATAATTISGGLTSSGATTLSGQVQGGTAAATVCPGSGTAIGSAGALASAYSSTCLGPIVPVNAVVIGKTGGTGWGGTTASTSGALNFIFNTGSVDRACTLYASNTTSGIIETGTASCPWTLNGSVDMGVNPISRISKLAGGAVCAGTTPLTSPAGNNVACRITAASSTAVLTFGAGYTTNIPICTASDETTTTTPVKVVPALGSVTLTPPGASDVIDVICIGNGTL